MRDPLIELWMVIANSKNEGVKEYLYKTKNHLKCCRESKYFLARWQAETDVRGRVTKLEDTQKSWRKKNRERKKEEGLSIGACVFISEQLILFAAILTQLLSFWWIIWCHFALLILVPKREEEEEETIQNTPISRFVNWKKPLVADTPTSYTLMSLLRKPNLTTYWGWRYKISHWHV